MAVFYVGSVQYAAIAVFAVSTAYSVGDIVRPITGNNRAYRCTTAGTSAGAEPAWTTTSGGTTTSGTATFTEITGVSTYGWNGAGNRMSVVLPKLSGNETLYLANDHDGSYSTSTTLALSTANFNDPILILCVDPAGSVPPVAADLSTGAKEYSTGGANLIINATAAYIRGVELTGGDAGAGGDFKVNDTASGAVIFENCIVGSGSTSGASFVQFGPTPTGGSVSSYVELINTQVKINLAGSSVYVGGHLLWRDTAVPLVGSALPTTMFLDTSTISGSRIVVLRNLDLTQFGSGYTLFDGSGTMLRAQVIDCKIDAAVTRVSTALGRGGEAVVEFINVSDGAHYNRNEKYGRSAEAAAALTTETTIVLDAVDGGASDGEQAVSWKVATGGNNNEVNAFECFPLSAWCDTAGSPVTATIEIVNDGDTLTNAEVWADVYYPGDATSPLGAFASSRRATPLTAAANVATSTVTWTTTGLASPVKQKVEVTFTPARVGLVTVIVRVGRSDIASLYVNPKVTLA